MNFSNKKYIWITVLICIMLLTGCSKFHAKTFDNSEEPTQSVKQEVEDNELLKDVSSTNENNKTEDKAEKQTEKSDLDKVTNNIEPAATIELPIYSINSDTLETEAVTALLPEGSDITPELIVNTVVETMADKALIIGIESVTTEDDKVIVNFSDNPSEMNIGSGIESAILYAIAQSLLDNLEDYSEVIYRINDGAYVTGHIELGINEVYLDNK